MEPAGASGRIYYRQLNQASGFNPGEELGREGQSRFSDVFHKLFVM